MASWRARPTRGAASRTPRPRETMSELMSSRRWHICPRRAPHSPPLRLAHSLRPPPPCSLGAWARETAREEGGRGRGEREKWREKQRGRGNEKRERDGEGEEERERRVVREREGEGERKRRRGKREREGEGRERGGGGRGGRQGEISSRGEAVVSSASVGEGSFRGRRVKG
eukprot:scaffold130997_cov28-Tisochrysis_lutea.AAC.2